MEAYRSGNRQHSESPFSIPHKENGDVDWKTLGDILTARITEEVSYGSYVDKKHRKSSPGFAVDTDWKYSYEENDVVVLKKQIVNSPIHCWMGRTVVEFPLEEISSFIQDPESALLYDRYINESINIDILRNSEREKDVIGYYKGEANHCLVKAVRDILFYYRCSHSDDRYIQTAVSVEYPLCPPVPGIIRAQVRPGSGWYLEPYRGSSEMTLISYVAHIDFINVPAIITNRLLKRQPLNLVYIKKHLKLRRMQKQGPELPLILPHVPLEGKRDENEESQFEDALSIKVFVHPSNRIKQSISEPHLN